MMWNPLPNMQTIERFGSTSGIGFPILIQKLMLRAGFKVLSQRNLKPVLLLMYTGKQGGGIGFELKTDVERYSVEVGYWLGEEFWVSLFRHFKLKLIQTQQVI